MGGQCGPWCLMGLGLPTAILLLSPVGGTGTEVDVAPCAGIQVPVADPTGSTTSTFSLPSACLAPPPLNPLPPPLPPNQLLPRPFPTHPLLPSPYLLLVQSLPHFRGPSSSQMLGAAGSRHRERARKCCPHILFAQHLIGVVVMLVDIARPKQFLQALLSHTT